jgi:FtsH-binding integral membrane protein
MATMVPRAAAGRRGAERLFYGAMTLAILMTVFVGFAPTYYLLDSFAGVTPLVHVHAAVFSAWVVLLLAQTSLVAAGRVDLHRRLGIVGVALVPLLLIVGFATTIAVAQRISRPPILAPPGRAMVALIALVAFGVISGLGLALRRNSQAHKRLLLVATINLTIAAVNRLPLPQVFDGLAARFAVADLLLVPLIVWDVMTRGRPHPMTLLAIGITVGQEGLQLLLSGSAAWNELSRWIISLV